MKKVSRIVAFALIACTLIMSVPAVALAEVQNVATEEARSGSCGLSAFWKLDDNGVLTIYGEGSTYAYTGKGMPWYEYKDEVTRIVIEEGIVSVGASSFYEFKNVNEIVLPDGLRAIGQYAFYGCSGVKTLNVPASVYYIGNYAFRKMGATGKIDIVFADTNGWYRDGVAMTSEYMSSVDEVTDDLRRQGYALNWNKVSETPAVIASGDCGKKATWTLDSNGTFTVSGNGNMPEYWNKGAPWFGINGAIVNVSIGEGITRVGKCSFYSADNILSVELPDSLKTISTYAFYHCRNLKEISIPSGVTAIGQYAFRQCKSLTSLVLGNKVGWSYGNTPIAATALTSVGAITYFTKTHYQADWVREAVLIDDTDKIYGYDFADDSWVNEFDKAGGATRSIVDDPAGSGEKVLAISHSASQTVSYVKNKTPYENVTSGKTTISVDLYVPSSALKAAGDYVQMQINGVYALHFNMVSDAKENITTMDTKDFPRDKWFKVMWFFDMDTQKCDVYIVEDGQIRSAVYLQCNASGVKDTGPTVARVYVAGSDQTVYVDRLGPVTTIVDEPVDDGKIYGYDFEDGSWTTAFDVAGGSTRAIVDDPAGSGEKVLAITHSATQSASWVRNKVAFENTASGNVTINLDLYIPADALAAAGDHFQLQINGEYNHHCNLVSDAKGSPVAFDTKDFPRDKWFKVQFIFDMDNLKYDLVIIEDGEIRTTIFSNRSASSLKDKGPLLLRAYLGGAAQTVYIDNFGIVTEKEIGGAEDEGTAEAVYGYDFKDDSWSSSFDKAGSATHALANNPVGSGDKVFSITHSASQSVSWIRNKENFKTATTGNLTVSVDLYIPSGALASAGDYVQLMLNNSPNIHVDLVSDAKTELGGWDTQNFPRDKWFKVVWAFDMDAQKYDLLIVVDGMEYATVFRGRGTSVLGGNGPINMRVLLNGSGQTVYADHIGTVVDGNGDPVTEAFVFDGVSFLRIDGLNVAGEKLSVYGDFSGNATAKDLNDIVWERCDTFDGAYTAIAGANGADHTPADGGYYIRVRAEYGAFELVSNPVYVREQSDTELWNAYLGANGEKLAASVVYNNEGAAVNATATVVVYEGTVAVATYTQSFTAKQGSDVVTFDFSAGDISGKRAVLTVTAGGDTLCVAETASDMPKAELLSDSTGSTVLIGGDEIAIFRSNRYMRFRPTVANDHWIGTDHNPVDMGFAYQEDGVKGLTNTKVEFVSAPGVFKISFTGKKEGLNTTQRNELIGFWNAEKQEFSFIYNAEMTADTELWHKNSSWAQIKETEAFDYCFERMSILDRVYNDNHNGDLYDYVIYENGDELIRIPKLPVPRYMLDGTYFYNFYLSPGESVYYPDANEGGWSATVLSDIGDTRVEICWSWYDIHNCLANSVPKLGSGDTFTVKQSWLFVATTAEDDAELIDNATEVDWKDIPNYQLPLFSENNTFETQFGGTEWQYAWWISSYDCTMDAEVGHNGAGSVKIEQSTAGEASWYTEGVWGYPYSFDEVKGKTFKVSGYIKTENVVGEAYIANIQFNHGTPDDTKVTRSDAVSGTSDWTYVSFTFVAQDGAGVIDHFYLTLNGTGTVWFDDVVIEAVVE